MKLIVEINVLDEALLRKFAAERMAASGFEDDVSLHPEKPLHDLVFEALIGSNPDPVSPVDMGLEIMNWSNGDDQPRS